MFLLVDNFDSFTFNLVQGFQCLGVFPEVRRNNDPQLLEVAGSRELELVVISPGPGTPKDSGLCLRLLECLSPEVPVFGVCLGLQVLAVQAGLKVRPGIKVMHGKTSLIQHDGSQLFSGLPNPFTAGRYHSLTVTRPSPGPLIVSCESEEREIMGLRYIDRPWMGVQFHPESVLTEQGQQILVNFLALAKTNKEGKNG